MSGATYTWTVTGGAGFVATSTTNSVRVNFKTSTSSTVSVRVTVNNLCGASASKSLEVKVNTACRMVDGEEEPTDVAVENVFQIYPNPASNKVYLEFTSKESETNSVYLFDLLGKAIYSENIDVIKGLNKKPIDLFDIPKGIYFLRLENKGQTLKATKVVVDK